MAFGIFFHVFTFPVEIITHFRSLLQTHLLLDISSEITLSHLSIPSHNNNFFVLADFLAKYIS